MEVAPDTKLIVCIYLTDRHPLVVCSHSDKLAIRETATRRAERATRSRVVRVGGSGLPGVIRDLMIIPSGHVSEIECIERLSVLPNGNPRVVLMRLAETRVCAVESETSAVVCDCREFAVGEDTPNRGAVAI